MTTTTYEDVLDQARRLPPEEQRQLGETLVTHGSAAPSTTAAPPIRPLSDDDRARLEAWFVAADELAARIGAAWKDDMNAAEAVNEQRREL